MSYWRFAAMIATSTVVMFILMYLNTYLLAHVFWSETRAYMALLMGATMAIIMLGFMLSMYSNKAINIAIFVGGAVVFAASLWLVRSQTTVGDTSYMRAMIPHHSIAIMTSSRANIEDDRVRKLADEIIYAQDKEIAQMRYLIDEIEASGVIPQEEEPPAGEIVSLEQALSTANVAVLDPGFMSEAEIARMFPDGATCTYSYTKDSPAVLAVGPVDGDIAALVKLSGDLVRLNVPSGSDPATGIAPRAEGISVQVTAPGGGPLNAQDAVAEADLTLELDAGLTAGFRGYYQCAA
ncbi:DUF305 domain-containing protein [Roseovarius sp. SCSIO 43702]|uniref:DUF305 domain-containing protein n=1 Tax=Roseovarius sp. SCSIO 43702 TaxID=2823043 RepID=UPI001C73318C|nr:DUF305 domain-containing protein [Roseovarius sp. SCSIO 43702]QYX58467.1 DUF305 domain-containing protein [Roseovarius sp. SCSIO 43702]